MKHKFLLALLPLFLFSCKEDKPRYDPNATIWINGRDNLTQNKSVDTKQVRLTVAEICAGDSIELVGWHDNGGGGALVYMINPTMDGFRRIDLVNNRLPMTAGNIDVLEDNVFLDPERRWMICKILPGLLDGDTLAYVPTSNRLTAAEALRPLFDPANGGRDANLDAIYKIFNEAFIFVPCTGEEYKELKARGEN